MRFARSEADQSYAIISGFVNITATGRFCSNLPSRIAVWASFLRPHHPLPHRPMRADRDAVGEIDDDQIGHADVAAGDGMADTLRLGGAVQADRVAQDR